MTRDRLEAKIEALELLIARMKDGADRGLPINGETWEAVAQVEATFLRAQLAALPEEPAEPIPCDPNAEITSPFTSDGNLPPAPWTAQERRLYTAMREVSTRISCGQLESAANVLGMAFADFICPPPDPRDAALAKAEKALKIALEFGDTARFRMLRTQALAVIKAAREGR